jgi:imidazolonepropionase-like amidohydrolase
VPEYAVAGLWDGHYRGPTRLTAGPGAVVDARPCRRGRTPWTVLPGLVDRHVHLGLVEHTWLAGSAVVEVHDLGWAPAEVLALRADPPAGVTIKIAGPFLTAPGGYPSGRPWAPPDSVRPVASAAAVDLAVEEARSAPYDLVKVALHADLPLLDEALLARLVSAAHRVGLTVAVHAEGAGQAARAIDAGADVLAHVPWTERLDDELLHRARHMVWLSTLAIHDRADRARAVDNLRRFRAAGGTVRYGTDMGNGPTTCSPR